MKIARRSLILLLVLATLVLVLRLFGIMWVAHWKTLTETEARKLIVKAQKRDFDHIPKVFAISFREREKNLGSIQGFKWIDSNTGLLGAPVIVTYAVCRNNRRYEETFYSDSPPDIDFYRY